MPVLIPLLVTLRTSRRTPLFTGLIVATLAVGIGATTLVFSIADGLVLHPFPFPEPDRLVSVGTAYPKLNRELSFWENLSPPEVVCYRRRWATLLGSHLRRDPGRCRGFAWVPGAGSGVRTAGVLVYPAHPLCGT